MHRDYSVAVIIGRFQPFHNNHLKLVEQGLEIADKVLILVGSAYAVRTPKNPFTFEERKAMILGCFPETVSAQIFEANAKDFIRRGYHHYFDCDRNDPKCAACRENGVVEQSTATQSTPYSGRIFVEPIRDYFYSDDVWLANVQAICADYIEDGETVVLLGAFKDASSYYLNLFPQWEYVPPGSSDIMDASSVREALFDVLYSKGWGDRGELPKFTDETLERQDKFFAKNLPDRVADYIKVFRHTAPFIPLAEEYEDNAAYKKSWAQSPFPPIFVTADTVVTCAGHVLVIRRGGNPGKGLLALPGGFVRENERVKPAALRELKEETRIKVDKLILESSIVDSAVFDYPGRSLRGRTITHAFHVKLRDGKLPEVKAGDDAKGAKWMTLADFFRNEEEVFEDHLHIVKHFVGG